MSEETVELRRALSELTSNPALSNPVRLSIMVALISRRVMTFSELQKVVNVSPSTLEEHLKRLAQLGYVEKRKTLYNLSVRTVVRPTALGIEKTLEYLQRLKSAIERILSRSQILSSEG